MYASTAVNNDSAGIPQAYVNQAYNLLDANKILMFVVIKFLYLIFLSSLIEMVASTERSFSSIYQFTEHVAKCLMI
jgi:hypothetical protein